MSATASAAENGEFVQRGEVTFSFAAISDKGQVRPKNEDSLLLIQELGYFGVCDGLGGHRAGEVASGLAARTLKEHLLEPPSLPPDQILGEAIQKAHRSILAAQEQHPEQQGMGTTLTSLWLHPEGGQKAQAWIGHIGDSRLYRLRGSLLEQLTDDHSPVFELFKLGKLSKDEIRRHPQKHLLSACLGTQESVQADIFPIALAAGDLFLICSDGLTDLLGDADLGNLAGADTTLTKRARDLAAEANRRGGPDNTSVILVDIVDVSLPHQ